MNPQIEMAHAKERRVKLDDNFPHPVHPGQQGLSPVQDDPGGPDAVPARVLSNSLGRLRNNLARHDHGLITPALVGRFVHIAMIAGQITATVYFDHELVNWY